MDVFGFQLSLIKRRLNFINSRFSPRLSKPKDNNGTRNMCEQIKSFYFILCVSVCVWEGSARLLEHHQLIIWPPLPFVLCRRLMTARNDMKTDYIKK